MIEGNSVFCDHPTEIGVHNVGLLDHEKGEGLGQCLAPMKTVLLQRSGGNYRLSRIGVIVSCWCRILRPTLDAIEVVCEKRGLPHRLEVCRERTIGEITLA